MTQQHTTALLELGAVVRFAKSGNPLVVDLRPVAPRVTDGVLEHLAPLESVRELYLDGAPIHDQMLGHLQRLAKLATLDLQRTAVTDAGLAQLKQLRSLKLLLLTGSQVSLDGVREIRKSMIQTRIIYV